MNMSSLRTWHLDAAAIATAAAVTAAVYALGVKPSSQARANAAQASSVLVQQSSRAQGLEAGIAEEKRALEEVRNELNAAAVELRPLDRLNSHLAAITSLAEESGLSLEAIAPGAPEPGRQFTRVPIRLSGFGSYPATMRFLSVLHQRHRDTGVSGFTLLGRPLEAGSNPSFEIGLAWHAASDG